tara:strand:- start:13657 stop:14001 length:345 start_codon:yes stop_codon:yes gene_type:complete
MRAITKPPRIEGSDEKKPDAADFISSAAVQSTSEGGRAVPAHSATAGSDKERVAPSDDHAAMAGQGRARRLMVQWNTRLPIDLVDRIDAFSASSGVSKQRIAEDALRQYFSKES